MIEDLKAKTATRFAHEAYRPKITSTEGARLYGGRWNPIGIGALYSSIERETALAEFTRGIDTEHPMKPSIMVSLIVSATTVADFTSAPFLDALGIACADLVSGSDDHDYRIPQHLGALAYSHPIDALLVPSAARPGGANLVIFERDGQAPTMVVIDVSR